MNGVEGQPLEVPYDNLDEAEAPAQRPPPPAFVVLPWLWPTTETASDLRAGKVVSLWLQVVLFPLPQVPRLAWWLRSLCRRSAHDANAEGPAAVPTPRRTTVCATCRGLEQYVPYVGFAAINLGWAFAAHAFLVERDGGIQLAKVAICWLFSAAGGLLEAGWASRFDASPVRLQRERWAAGRLAALVGASTDQVLAIRRARSREELAGLCGQLPVPEVLRPVLRQGAAKGADCRGVFCTPLALFVLSLVACAAFVTFTAQWCEVPSVGGSLTLYISACGGLGSCIMATYLFIDWIGAAHSEKWLRSIHDELGAPARLAGEQAPLNLVALLRAREELVKLRRTMPEQELPHSITAKVVHVLDTMASLPGDAAFYRRLRRLEEFREPLHTRVAGAMPRTWRIPRVDFLPDYVAASREGQVPAWIVADQLLMVLPRNFQEREVLSAMASFLCSMTWNAVIYLLLPGLDTVGADAKGCGRTQYNDVLWTTGCTWTLPLFFAPGLLRSVLAWWSQAHQLLGAMLEGPDAVNGLLLPRVRCSSRSDIAVWGEICELVGEFAHSRKAILELVLGYCLAVMVGMVACSWYFIFQPSWAPGVLSIATLVTVVHATFTLSGVLTRGVSVNSQMNGHVAALRAMMLQVPVLLSCRTPVDQPVECGPLWEAHTAMKELSAQLELDSRHRFCLLGVEVTFGKLIGLASAVTPYVPTLFGKIWRYWQGGH